MTTICRTLIFLLIFAQALGANAGSSTTAAKPKEKFGMAADNGAARKDIEGNGAAAVTHVAGLRLGEIAHSSDFGAAADRVTDNTAAIQLMIDAPPLPASVAEFPLFPLECEIALGTKFHMKSLVFKRNVGIVYSPSDDLDRPPQSGAGRTNERHYFTNRQYSDGTSVNETVLEAPHHPALSLDIRQDIARVGTSPANEFASVVIRKENNTKWQLGRYTDDSFAVNAYNQQQTVNIGTSSLTATPILGNRVTGATSGAWGTLVSVAADSSTIAMQHLFFTDGERLKYQIQRAITGISKSVNATIIAKAHGYRVGESVTLDRIAGMTELNGVTATILATPTADTFTIDVDTTTFGTYSNGGIALAELTSKKAFSKVRTANGVKHNRFVARGNAQLGAGTNLPLYRATDSWTVGGSLGIESADADGTNSSFGSTVAQIRLANDLQNPTDGISARVDTAGRRVNITNQAGQGLLSFMTNTQQVETSTLYATSVLAAPVVRVGKPFSLSLPQIVSGAGSPEGVVTAPKGSLYLNTDGGVGMTLYVKEMGAGNTGWAAK